jgi:GMP synthase-like glutamine amidotransferase
MPPALTPRPLLLLNCYLSGDPCPALFTPPLGVRAKVVKVPHVPLDSLVIDLADYRGLVITGSAASVLDEASWSLFLEELIREAHSASIPLFGVCYGHQLIANALFGPAQVRRSPTPEFGWYKIHVTTPEGPVASAPNPFLCFLSHYDEVTAPRTDELQVLAHSERCGVQAFRVANKPIWGVQFHAEMDFDEAVSIFQERVENSPELGIDADAHVASAVSTRELWRAIYGSFLDSLPA